MSAPDPITVSVIQHRLTAIVEEMGEAMLRTSYSQILNSSRDFSTALCDNHVRLVAQAEHIPVHVGALTWALKEVVARFGGKVKKGDLYLLNDPYRGGSHLPDVTAFVPVFAGEELLFWTVNRAHHSDIGGSTHGAYNPEATEIFHEGIRLPPIKLYDQGVCRDDLLDMLALNVRLPRDFLGDLAAQLGSVRLGEQRMEALFADFGADTVTAAVELILDGAERQARAAVAAWPDGIYEGQAFLDDDGFGREDIKIHAKVTIAGDTVEIDMTGSDPESRGFVNSSHANTQSAIAMAFSFLLDPATPKNSGTIRPLSVKLKQGTMVYPNEGLPVTMCTSHCGNEIIESVISALSAATPDRAMGGWGRRFRLAIQGEDPRNGKKFIWHMFHARPGGGGSINGDGWHCSGEWHSAGGLKFGSVEVAEVRFPLLFKSHEFRPGSAGEGQFKGGVGAVMEMQVETAGPARANTAGDGIKYGARGISGGQDGAPHDYRHIHAANGSETKLKTKLVGIPVEPGDVFRVHSGGGGGWGDSALRDPALNALDEELGLV
jgi:N-methylhydantoinase B